MGQLEQTEKAEAAVFEAFHFAIIAEKVDTLLSLTSLWSSWRSMAKPMFQDSLLDLAIKNDKVKAAEILLIQGAITDHPNDENLTPLEYALVSGSEKMTELLMKFNVKPARALVRSKVIRGSLKRGFIQPLLDTGIKPDAIFIRAVDLNRYDAIEALFNEGLSMGALDYGLTSLEPPSKDMLSSITMDQYARIKFALHGKGARNWSEFLPAAKDGEYLKLKEILDRESTSDTGCLNRLIMASKTAEASTLHLAISGIIYEDTYMCTRTQSVAILIEYAVGIAATDEIGRTALHYAQCMLPNTNHFSQCYSIQSQRKISTKPTETE